MTIRSSTSELAPYLGASRWIDPHSAALRAWIGAHGLSVLAPLSAARRAFVLVRDEIAHSWDVRSHRVVRTGSEALEHREGLCYAKAMLLAALLRALGIPAGLGYQRLLSGDTPAEGYCLHGLTTAFLDGRWLRLDARGNKPGIDAQFSLEREQLAFTLRPELGEQDLEGTFAEPPRALVDALDSHDDLHVLMRVLPDVT
ncbi:MAG: transglutaminase domain-containing protein [Kofleriaceae bacterium]|nr:transglutaminase domain-containing protein [Kofleriaceae bacterium]